MSSIYVALKWQEAAWLRDKIPASLGQRFRRQPIRLRQWVIEEGSSAS
jgi:hypothetical protein